MPLSVYAYLSLLLDSVHRRASWLAHTWAVWCAGRGQGRGAGVGGWVWPYELWRLGEDRVLQRWQERGSLSWVAPVLDLKSLMHTCQCQCNALVAVVSCRLQPPFAVLPAGVTRHDGGCSTGLGVGFGSGVSE